MRVAGASDLAQIRIVKDSSWTNTQHRTTGLANNLICVRSHWTSIERAIAVLTEDNQILVVLPGEVEDLVRRYSGQQMGTEGERRLSSRYEFQPAAEIV
jgi:hypothetical protein